MPSLISWLDYDDHDRQLVMNAVESLAERQPVDELGLSTIRNAFANAFFPGTSTLHTRLRYFLFVSWIFRDSDSKSDPIKAARRQEEALIEALEEREPRGVIGSRSGPATKRLPGVVYWNGLQQWGLFRSNDDIDGFFRARSSIRGLSASRDDDGNSSGSSKTRWDPNLPHPPEDFLKGTSFELTPEEGQYLTERILQNCKGSILEHAVRKLQKSPNLLEEEDATFPWESTVVLDGLNPDLSRLLTHAQAFSEATHGAWILYNLMLAEAVCERKGLPVNSDADVQYYREKLREWPEPSRLSALTEWRINEFFDLPLLRPIKQKTRDFVTAWVTNKPWTQPQLDNHTQLRQLIRAREADVKRDRARLDNPRALERWQGGAGLGRADYRWRIARSHLADLGAALAKGAE